LDDDGGKKKNYSFNFLNVKEKKLVRILYEKLKLLVQHMAKSKSEFRKINTRPKINTKSDN